MSGPIQVRVYQGATQAEAARKFEADATEAALTRWIPTSQAWEGSTLTVTYQHQDAPVAVAPLPPTPPPPAPPPQNVYVQHSGGGVGGGVRSGMGFGLGCLLFIVGLVVVIAILGSGGR